MKIQLLEDLYRKSLFELQDGEKQMLRILPGMEQAAGAEELKRLFKLHAEETGEQLKRLELLVGRFTGQRAAKSKATAGLVAQATELLKQGATDTELLDAALTGVAQKMEAIEITSYACAHNFARLLGFHDQLRPLEESFHEEERMEEHLSNLAESLELDELESEVELDNKSETRPSPRAHGPGPGDADL